MVFLATRNDGADGHVASRLVVGADAILALTTNAF
jgi:hypothetical protein